MNSAPFADYMSHSYAVSAAYHSIIEKMKASNTQNKIDMGVEDQDLQELVAPKHWAMDDNEDYIFIVGPDM